MRKFLFAPFLMVLLFAACTHEAYESGDSKYSYLRSDFVEATTNAAATFVMAETDDGEKIVLAPPLKTKWATSPDSIYRALLYYNRFSDRKEPISLIQIPVLKVQQTNDNATTIDPVGFTSAWLAKNKRYINLELALKTGEVKAEKQPLQSLGTAVIAKKVMENGATKYEIQLLHKQKGVPEYYTTRTFVSIPTTLFHANDSIEVIVKTYNGTIKKGFRL